MTRLFIGGLKEGASRTELEDEFGQFGELKEVWVARKPPGFGFILFEDERDADTALKEMDGKYICGGRIRVEYARAGSGGGGGGGRGGDRGGPRGGDRMECGNCGRSGHISRECRKGASQSYGGRDNFDRGDRGYNGRIENRRSRSRSFERDRRPRRRSPSPISNGRSGGRR